MQYDGEDDAARTGLQGTVDHQKGAGMDARVDHGIALDLDKERGSRMRDQVFVQVKRLVDEIIGGRREPGMNPRSVKHAGTVGVWRRGRRVR